MSNYHQEYLGGLVPQLQSQDNDFDPVRGWNYKAVYTSFDSDAIGSMSNLFSSLGITNRINYVNETGQWTLFVADSTLEYTLDNWEIESDEERIDLWSHPVIVAIFNSYADGDDMIAVIRDSLENNTAYADITGTTLDELTPDDNDVIANFYSLYQRGTTEYRNDFEGTGYVVKHDTNVSRTWTVNVADTNVGCVYTTAELLSEVQNTSLWINPIPTRLVYKIGVIASTASEFPPANYMWGWLKSRSRERTAANNRVSIETLYTFALWSVQPLGIYPVFL